VGTAWRNLGITEVISWQALILLLWTPLIRVDYKRYKREVRKEERMSRIVGIDLGTTNSLVAVVEGGRPMVIPNRFGSRTTPSVVRFLPDGQTVVGEPAERARMQDPQHTVSGIKRFIGRFYNEVSDLAELAPYPIVAGEDDRAMVHLGGRNWSPPEISAMVLRELKESAEMFLGEEVDRAVVTIPAYFNDAQRRATAEAVRLAGLELVRLVAEPTAAAMAYGLAEHRDRTVLVLDLGGGTYDVSLLEMGDGVVEVRAIDGDGHLGGDDFDEILLQWAHQEVLRQHGFDILFLPEVAQRVREAVTAAKCALSHVQSQTIELPFLFQRAGSLVDVSLKLEREDFGFLCDELFERLVPPIERVLANGGITAHDMGEVLLVGSATRMERVSEVVKNFFGREPSHRVNPEEAVGLGAAVQAGILYGSIRDTLLLDVIPFPISVEGEGGIAVCLIDANTTLPTRKSEIFTTSLDEQTSIEVHVLQGKREISDDNQTLGRLTLEELPSAPRGTQQIEVSIDIDANQDIHVTAKDLASGRSTELALRLK
jgi:molecular chaperone DnaK